MVVLGGFQVQVDEYKQLKETLNKMPSLRHAAGQPQPHEAAHPIQPGQNGNEEEHHQPQNAQPEVFVYSSCIQNRGFSHSYHWFECGSRQVEKHDEVEKPQPHHKEEDGEMGGAEERRRELAEEEMEQAGQPQKLEEEFDVAHNGEEEPQANQPDENALEREQRHAHEVRTLLNVNIINIKS